MDYEAASYVKFVDARQHLGFADEQDAAGWPMEFVRRTVLRQGVSASVGLRETSWHENLAVGIDGLSESVVKSKVDQSNVASVRCQLETYSHAPQIIIYVARTRPTNFWSCRKTYIFRDTREN